MATKDEVKEGHFLALFNVWYVHDGTVAPVLAPDISLSDTIGYVFDIREIPSTALTDLTDDWVFKEVNHEDFHYVAERVPLAPHYHPPLEESI